MQSPLRKCLFAVALLTLAISTARAQNPLPDAPSSHLEIAQNDPASGDSPKSTQNGLKAPQNDTNSDTQNQPAIPPKGVVAVSGQPGTPSAKYVMATPQGHYFGDFRNSVFRLDTLLVPPITAAFAMNFPLSNQAGYGTGATEFIHEYGVALGNNVEGKFFRKFVIADLAQHRDNYVPMPRGTGWKARTNNVIKHNWYVDPQVDTSLDIHTFNWASIPGSAISASFANIYVPAQQRTLSATLIRMCVGQAGYLAGDIWTELMVKYPRISHIVHYSYSVEANYSNDPNH